MTIKRLFLEVNLLSILAMEKVDLLCLVWTGGSDGRLEAKDCVRDMRPDEVELSDSPRDRLSGSRDKLNDEVRMDSLGKDSEKF